MPALARFTSEIPFQPLREGLLPSDDFHESSDSWVPWGRERQLRCPFKLAPSQPLLSGMGAVYLRRRYGFRTISRNASSGVYFALLPSVPLTIS